MKHTGLILIALLFVVGATPLWAPCDQTGCHTFDEDPGDGCLGPDDPFCQPDDGGGGSCAYENCSGCYTCSWIPSCLECTEGSYWCSESGLDGEHPYCTGYDWGCSMTGTCQIA